MAKKKNAKNKNKNVKDDSDDDFPDIMKMEKQEDNQPAETTGKNESKSQDPLPQSAPNQPSPAGGKKGKKGKNTPPQQPKKKDNRDSSDEDSMAKMAKEMKLSEKDSSEEEPEKTPKLSAKQKRNQKKSSKKFVNLPEPESSEDSEASSENENDREPASNKFGMLIEGDDDGSSEQEEDSLETPPKQSKFAALESSDHDSEEDSSREAKKTTTKSKPKKKSSKTVTEKDESELEPIDKSKKPKKSKKGKEKSTNDLDLDPDKSEKPKKKKKDKKNKDDATEDNDLSEAPKKEKSKKSKKKNLLENTLLADIKSGKMEPMEPLEVEKAQTSSKSKRSTPKNQTPTSAGRSSTQNGDNGQESEPTDQQQFNFDDTPIEEDPNAFKEKTPEELSAMSKKDRRKYIKELEAYRQQVEDAKIDQVATGTSSLQNFSVSQPRDETSKETLQDLSDDIKIEGFSIGAKGKVLYNNADLRIIHGRKYGLIGPNGKGKTTLLRCIAAHALKIPKHIDLLYCEQEVQADETPAIDSVLSADLKRKELLEHEKRLLKEQEQGKEINQDELKKVYDDMKAHGVDAAEPRARRILAGLGFTLAMQKRATQDFSGGWRMRVSLARALFLEPTLLMLDEPTNHLDLNAVIWLNSYLCNWKHTLLIVSHDQQFLDDVCTDVVHLDDCKLHYYRGNYSHWKEQYKIYLTDRLKQYEKQEKKIKELKAKGKTKAVAEKKQKEALTRKQQKGKKRTEMTEASADTMAELISKPREYEVDFTFPNPPQLAPPVLGLYDVSFGYKNQPALFKSLEFGIDMDSRISIVGPNGVGKSTLLKLLLGEVEPTSGELRRNHRLRTAYYSQHSAEALPLDKSPVEHLTGTFKEVDVQYSRKLLGSCGLSGHAHTIPIKDLSGGQKARVALGELICSHPDIIILDEPTNNLDIESIDALGAAINNYDGGVIIVSHDARLITATDCLLYVVENRNLRKIDGGFLDYKDEVMAEVEDMVERNS